MSKTKISDLSDQRIFDVSVASQKEKGFLARLRPSTSMLSSDDVNALFLAGLVPADVWMTDILRYPRLYEKELAFSTSGEGSTIAYCSTHLWAGILLMLGIGGIVATNIYLQYTQNQKTKDKAAAKMSCRQMIDKLTPEKVLEEKEEQELKEKRQQQLIKMQTEFSECLRQILQDDPIMSARYEYILMPWEQTDEEKRKSFTLTFKLKEDAQFKAPPVKHTGLRAWYETTKQGVKKSIGPLIEWLDTASYLYWILWISASVFTGILDYGVVGMPVFSAFFIPLACGFLYPLFKVKNYCRNQNPAKDPQVKYQALKDNNEMMQRASAKMRKDKLKAELDACEIELTHLQSENIDAVYLAKKENEAKLGLVHNYRSRMAVTFLSNLVGRYVASQYVAWILLDFMKAATGVIFNLVPEVNLAIGIVIFVTSGIVAVYKTIQAHYTFKDDEANIKKLEAERDKETHIDLQEKIKAQKSEIDDLLRQMADKKATLAKLQGQVNTGEANNSIVEKAQEYSKVEINPSEPKLTFFQKAKNFGTGLFTVNDGFCTGAMLTRFFLVPGSAIFLPFVAVGVALPYTLPIIIAVGLCYGVFKWYQKQARIKEEAARNLLAELPNLIRRAKEDYEYGSHLKQGIVAMNRSLDAEIAAREAVLSVQVAPTIKMAPVPSVYPDLSQAPIVRTGYGKSGNVSMFNRSKSWSVDSSTSSTDSVTSSADDERTYNSEDELLSTRVAHSLSHSAPIAV